MFVRCLNLLDEVWLFSKSHIICLNYKNRYNLMLSYITYLRSTSQSVGERLYFRCFMEFYTLRLFLLFSQACHVTSARLLATSIVNHQRIQFDTDGDELRRVQLPDERHGTTALRRVTDWVICRQSQQQATDGQDVESQHCRWSAS